jgi:hypothetical protein
MKKVYIFLIISVFFIQCAFPQENAITHVSNHYQNHFGWGISGDNGYCAISDPRDSTSGYANGCVNIYQKSAENWGYVSTLHNEIIQPYDFFGYKIKMYNNRLAVTSIGDKNKGFMAGAVHIYNLDNGVWKYTQTLRQDTAQEKVLFGESVCMNGNYLFIGAPGTNNTGAVYIYILSGDNYTFLQKINNPYPLRMQFGSSLAISGDFLFIGAPSTNMALYKGTVLIYIRNGNKWDRYNQQLEIDPNNEDYGSLFGFSIGAEENKLLIGAPHANVIGADIEEYFFAGKVYYYKNISGIWTKQKEFSNPDPDSHDLFGSDVAVSDSILFVSCPRDDRNKDDDGALYMFKEEVGTWKQGSIKKDVSLPNVYFSKSFDVFDNILFVGTGGNKTEKNSGNVYYYDVQKVLGINLTKKSGEELINVFPNPARDRIFVEIKNKNPHTIKIFSANGQVHITKRGRGSQEVKVSGLANGAYIVSVNINNQTYTKEIIVQH